LTQQEIEEVERVKREILDTIRKDLENNVENLRAYLKSQVPKRGHKTPEEYKSEMVLFKEKLKEIKVLLDEYNKYNRELVNRVADYLVESWRMVLAGKSEKDIEKYKKKTRNEYCAFYDQQVEHLKSKIKHKLQPSGRSQDTSKEIVGSHGREERPHVTTIIHHHYHNAPTETQLHTEIDRSGRGTDTGNSGTGATGYSEQL